MARRNQLRGICHDLLETFVSRSNDLHGYWALGQYQSYVRAGNLEQLNFDLIDGTADMDAHPFAEAIAYYSGAVLRLMRANAMADTWLKEASITFKSIGPKHALCIARLMSDYNRTFRDEQVIRVNPHDPLTERRRVPPYGPSNQKKR